MHDIEITSPMYIANVDVCARDEQQLNRACDEQQLNRPHDECEVNRARDEQQADDAGQRRRQCRDDDERIQPRLKVHYDQQIN